MEQSQYERYLQRQEEYMAELREIAKAIIDAHQPITEAKWNEMLKEEK